MNAVTPQIRQGAGNTRMRMERLELATDSCGARVLREHLTERLAELRADEQAVVDFALAVSEAFSNAVNYGDAARGQVLAALHYGRSYCAVTLSYPGDPFPLAAPTLPEPDATRGRGRYLMQRLSDQVEYEFDAGMTHVKLVKTWKQ
jgi:anti-sigma regulatory factor (Ser/Thr protein kinase)